MGLHSSSGHCDAMYLKWRILRERRSRAVGETVGALALVCYSGPLADVPRRANPLDAAAPKYSPGEVCPRRREALADQRSYIIIAVHVRTDSPCVARNSESSESSSSSSCGSGAVGEARRRRGPVVGRPVASGSSIVLGPASSAFMDSPLQRRPAPRRVSASG